MARKVKCGRGKGQDQCNLFEDVALSQKFKMPHLMKLDSLKSEATS